ncbi:hypothetical protein [Lolliginicoccus levis]|uniref:hypothetical protein n=1 Tax=Lolliginicoccus levis TaxID=2919542 RepID=UPI00241CEBC0|nr:hypothetical protein [Lolliginicoccus levis]
MVTTIHDLPEDARVSLLAGYDLGESEIRGLLHEGLDAAKTQHADPQAFEDGLRLRDAIYFIGWADSVDFEAAESEYSQIAREVNERYGDIVMGLGEAWAASKAASTSTSLGFIFGLRGYQ